MIALKDYQHRVLDSLRKFLRRCSQTGNPETAFREALNHVKEYKPTGNPQEMLAKQTELARKAFDATVNNTREFTELVKKSNVDALKIISDRITGSITEIRGTFEQGAKEKR